MATDDPASTNWHLDKRVPIALIFAIAIQTGTAIWWAATTTGRITNVEAMVQGGLTSRLNRIEDKLDRLIESRAERSYKSGSSNP